MEFQKKKITIKNEEFAYIEKGTGNEVILLLHGNMSSSVYMLPLIDELCKSYRVIAPDLRGFGDSTYNERINELKDFADDVKDLLDALNIKEVYAAGWSTGGGVVLELAATYPQLVKKLISIEGASHLGYAVYQKDQFYQPIPKKVYNTREEMGLDPVQVAPMVGILENNDAESMKNIYDKVIYTVNKPDEDINEIYINETLKQRNLVDVDWALSNFNMSNGYTFYSKGSNKIKDINCECLFTCGQNDITVPPYMVLENIAALGNKAKLVTYKDCGHSPLVDKLDTLIEDIKNFIK